MGVPASLFLRAADTERGTMTPPRHTDTQLRRLALLRWHAHEGSIVDGPTNLDLHHRVEELLRRDPDMLDEGAYEALWKEVRGLKAAPRGKRKRLPTVWYHGSRCYSLDGYTRVGVSKEQHHFLNAFFVGGVALDTAALKDKGVGNASRVVDQLEERFPGTVRRPVRKGQGYFVRVRARK